MKLNKRLQKSLSYILLPVMVLFTFQSAFAGNYRNQQSVNRGLQQSLTINNLSLTINTNPFKYSGYYSDSESGLYYLKARYYSAKLMRFINRDTYDLSNRYAYGNGDPVNNMDPTGHSAVSWLPHGIAGWIGFCVAAVAGLAVGWACPASWGVLGEVAAGGIANGLGEMAQEGLDNKKLNMKSIGFQVLVGAVTNAVCYGMGRGFEKLNGLRLEKNELSVEYSRLAGERCRAQWRINQDSIKEFDELAEESCFERKSTYENRVEAAVRKRDLQRIHMSIATQLKDMSYSPERLDLLNRWDDLLETSNIDELPRSARYATAGQIKKCGLSPISNTVWGAADEDMIRHFNTSINDTIRSFYRS